MRRRPRSHPRSPRRPLGPGLLALALVGACVGEPGRRAGGEADATASTPASNLASTPASTPATAPTKEPVAPPPAPTPTPALAAGPAYLMISQGPIVRVDAGGFTTIRAPEAFLYPSAQAPGVGPHLSGLHNTIYAIEGDAVRVVAAGDRARSCVPAVVRGPADLLFVCGYDVHTWDGVGWTRAEGPERDPLDGRYYRPAGAAVDDTGALWVASNTAVYRQDPGGWTRIAHADAIGRITALAAGPGGLVYALGGNDLHVMSTAAPEPRVVDLGLTAVADLSALRVSPRGDVAITGRGLADPVREAALGLEGSLPGFDPSDTHLEWFVAIRDVDGRLARYTLSESVLVGLPSALAIDGRGRAWWGAPHGVAILAVDAAPVHWWRGTFSGDVPPRTDFDRYNARGGVGSVLVVDGGPDLPELPTATETRAKGRLKDGRRPLAGVDLEACITPRHDFHGSPCAHAVGRRATTTGADGRFELTGLHPGEHQVFARSPDGWRSVHALIVVPGVKTREVALGDLTLTL